MISFRTPAALVLAGSLLIAVTGWSQTENDPWLFNVVSLYPTRPQPSSNILVKEAGAAAVVSTPDTEGAGVILGDKPLLYLAGLDPRRSMVAWSPDGKRVATAWGLDGPTQADGKNVRAPIARIWDALMGRELLTITDSASASSLAWSTDGTRLAIGMTGPTAKIWDTQTGRELLSLDGAPGRASWSPDGKRVATATWKKTCLADLFDATTGTRLRSLRFFRPMDNKLGGLAWNPVGKQIAAACDGTVVVWNSETGEQLGMNGFFDVEVTSLAWSRDGNWLAAACTDAVRVWDAHSGLGESRKLPTSGGASSVAWSPDGKFLAVARQVTAGGPQGLVQVWDTKTWEESLAFSTVVSSAYPSARVTSVGWSPDGARLAMAGAGGVAIWAVPSGLLAPRIAPTPPRSLEDLDPPSSCFGYVPQNLVVKSNGDVSSDTTDPDANLPFSLHGDLETKALLRVMMGHSRMCWNGSVQYDLSTGHDVLLFWPGRAAPITPGSTSTLGPSCSPADVTKLSTEHPPGSQSFFVRDASGSRILQFGSLQRARDAITAAFGSSELCIVGGLGATDTKTGNPVGRSGRIVFWK